MKKTLFVMSCFAVTLAVAPACATKKPATAAPTASARRARRSMQDKPHVRARVGTSPA